MLAGEIFKLQTKLEWWKRQMFAVSASGECLDKLASQRGIERKKAMKSTGEITFKDVYKRQVQYLTEVLL